MQGSRYKIESLMEDGSFQRDSIFRFSEKNERIPGGRRQGKTRRSGKVGRRVEEGAVDGDAMMLEGVRRRQGEGWIGSEDGLARPCDFLPLGGGGELSRRLLIGEGTNGDPAKEVRVVRAGMFFRIWWGTSEMGKARR
jgi:hypothetical protein